MNLGGLSADRAPSPMTQAQRPLMAVAGWSPDFFLAFFAWPLGASTSLIGALISASALTFTVGSLIKILRFPVWLDLQQ